jgi:hypothetical protein
LRAWSALIHGLEVGRQQVGEVQQQVGQVAFGINHQRRHAVERRLFQQATHRPVLPEPVMPTTTAWVVRSAES